MPPRRAGQAADDQGSLQVLVQVRQTHCLSVVLQLLLCLDTAFPSGSASPWSMQQAWTTHFPTALAQITPGVACHSVGSSPN